LTQHGQGFLSCASASVPELPRDDLFVKELSAGFIVVNDQHARVDEFIDASTLWGGFGLAGEPENHPESRTFPQGALDADAPMHRFRQALANG
jgi:hypothetical protein